MITFTKATYGSVYLELITLYVGVRTLETSLKAVKKRGNSYMKTAFDGNIEFVGCSAVCKMGGKDYHVLKYIITTK